MGRLPGLRDGMPANPSPGNVADGMVRRATRRRLTPAGRTVPGASLLGRLMFDLEQTIRTIGLVGVFAIVFAETGLLIGFFLPGDSLLFTAGFLASQDVFDINALSIGCFVAAVMGNLAGYSFGHRVG